jgi:iron complex outermembrane receptor protein
LKSRHSFLLGSLFMMAGSQALAAPAVPDLTQIPLEQLLEIEVITASRIARQVSSAPSAVSIVTAQDIRDHGYRTLADILSSMRGLNITYDRAYEFVGGRGYGSPGDYSGRIMLLIDGIQANDNFYNQAYLGTDGLLDTELIERVEYVSGPGSVSYGNNAFYGIINIITKKGRNFDGAEVSLAAGSYDSRKARVTFGKQFENGVDLLVSASGFDSEGQDLYFPEFDDGNPANNKGVSRNLDGQRNHRLFGKAQGDHWLVEAGYAQRHKDLPAAPYGTDFNTPQYYDDTNMFISGQYHADLSPTLKLSVQGDYGDYLFRGAAPFAGTAWKERTAGRHWALDAKFVGSWYQNHKIIFGGAYRHDYERKFSSPAVSFDQGQESFSLYAEDEITLRDNLWVNLGVRADRFSDDDGSAFSPRAALIYRPTPDITLRLSHSRASRTPTAYEKYYSDGGVSQPNPALDMEHVRATEFIVEKQWGAYARLLASVYRQSTDDAINSTFYPSGLAQFQNGGTTHADGIELEYERNWDAIRLRTNYAYQRSRDENHDWSVNAPRHIGKFNLTAPLFSNFLRTGIEVQSISKRQTFTGEMLGGYTLANLTIGTERLVPNLDITLSARNLFDRKYSHVAPDYNDPVTAIEQDGRNFWLQLTYRLR